MTKNIMLWTVIAVVLVLVFNTMSQKPGAVQEYAFSDLVYDIENGRVQSITIQGQEAKVQLSGDTQVRSAILPPASSAYEDVIDAAKKNNVRVESKKIEEGGFWSAIFWLLPTILMIVFWIFILRQMQGGGGKGAMSFGKSKARLMGEDQIKTT
ncbi:MAG: ATP-dependent metallopeptidase FtsH/Yme1/Tma family protein, partial [Gammaproteobacteria bacterium]|nr:ATP-dependent metallopeptidase FtsH/Yme1/Tma family protein [Gammaproteobacteria bacterium]